MLLPLLLGQGTGGASPTNYTLACDAGSYTLTGKAATLSVKHSLVCSAGSYSLAGQAATLAVKHSLTCNAGSYTLTGNAATLKIIHSLTCNAGAYTLTGNDATLTYVAGVSGTNYTLTCNAGAYALTGNNAALNVAHSLTCSAGSYTLTSGDISLSIGYGLNCDAGAYSLTGNAATLDYASAVNNYTLTCAPGAYGLSANYVDEGYIEDGYVGNVVFIKSVAEQNQTGGGGYFAYHAKKLRKKIEYEEQKAKEIYKEILESAPIEIKKQAIAIVKPFSEKNIPTVSSIDWIALEHEKIRVNALLALWQEQIDIEREDEEVLLLM